MTASMITCDLRVVDPDDPSNVYEVNLKASTPADSAIDPGHVHGVAWGVTDGPGGRALVDERQTGVRSVVEFEVEEAPVSQRDALVAMLDFHAGHSTTDSPRPIQYSPPGSVAWTTGYFAAMTASDWLEVRHGAWSGPVRLVLGAGGGAL